MKAFMLGLAVALAAAGCGGRSDEGSSAALQAGIYTYELTEEYLLENGISAEQAANESGKHQAILREDGAFTDSWTTANGGSGSCSGTYEEGDGSRVTFKWSTGCFGDWEMTYTVKGDRWLGASTRLSLRTTPRRTRGQQGVQQRAVDARRRRVVNGATKGSRT